MQGTVATFDAGHRSGTLLLDDGTALAFPAAAFAASGLRLLRLGQRVRIERDAGRRPWSGSRCRPCLKLISNGLMLSSLRVHHDSRSMMAR